MIKNSIQQEDSLLSIGMAHKITAKIHAAKLDSTTRRNRKKPAIIDLKLALCK